MHPLPPLLASASGGGVRVAVDRATVAARGLDCGLDKKKKENGPAAIKEVGDAGSGERKEARKEGRGRIAAWGNHGE